MNGCYNSSSSFIQYRQFDHHVCLARPLFYSTQLKDDWKLGNDNAGELEKLAVQLNNISEFCL